MEITLEVDEQQEEYIIQSKHNEALFSHSVAEEKWHDDDLDEFKEELELLRVAQVSEERPQHESITRG